MLANTQGFHSRACSDARKEKRRGVVLLLVALAAGAIGLWCGVVLANEFLVIVISGAALAMTLLAFLSLLEAYRLLDQIVQRSFRERWSINSEVY